LNEERSKHHSAGDTSTAAQDSSDHADDGHLDGITDALEGNILYVVSVSGRLLGQMGLLNVVGHFVCEKDFDQGEAAKNRVSDPVVECLGFPAQLGDEQAAEIEDDHGHPAACEMVALFVLDLLVFKFQLIHVLLSETFLVEAIDLERDHVLIFAVSLLVVIVVVLLVRSDKSLLIGILWTLGVGSICDSFFLANQWRLHIVFLRSLFFLYFFLAELPPFIETRVD
jgi:hypothetical protein